MISVRQITGASRYAPLIFGGIVIIAGAAVFALSRFWDKQLEIRESASQAAVALPAGVGWHELPNTKLTSVCPSAQFGYDFQFYCANQGAVTGAWNGGIADTKRNRLIVWGGGHGDYAGNEVYALDLNDLTMKRLNNPSPPTSGSSPAASDGKANSRHTYSGLAYIEHLDKMYVFSGSLYSSGVAQNDTWFLDLATLEWTRISASGPRAAYNVHAFYDPQTKKVFLGDTSGLWRFDPDARTYTRITSYFHELPTSSVLDPKRRIWLTVGGHYNSPNSPFLKAVNVDTGVAVNLNLSGCGAITTAQAPGNQDGSGPAMAYDPVSDKIVAWMSGDTIWLLDLATQSCSSRTFTGGPGSPERQGTYGRFRYFPALGVFALVNHASQNAYLLRLTTSGAPATNTADLNADGRVDVIDLGILLSAWGQTTKPKSDINQDGRVDVIDLGILLSKWG